MNKLEEILKEQNQEHLLNFCNIDRKKLEKEILNINFNQLNQLYKGVHEEKDMSNVEVQPILCVEKDKLSEEEYKKYKLLGEKIIKNHQYAVVTMAGGQGTRLGHNGPKGTYDFGLESHKSIFEILCEELKKAYEKYNVYIPWYIMTSEQNHEDTINFFKEKDYFSYPKQEIIFFKQGELPVLDEQGKLLLDKNGSINKAADGHGGIFVSMRKNNVIKDMKKRGIKWAFIGPVDNILVKMTDSIFIGICEDKNVLAGGKSIIKAYPEEKVGVFCKKQGKPSVIEYTEISKEMAEKKDNEGNLVFAESHINCNLFNIDVIEEVSKDKLPYHSANKKIEYLAKDGNIIKPNEPNAYKFESFIFDAFEQLEDMAIFRVKREEEFAPIKNADGKDSPETARKLYKEFHKIGG